MCGQEIRDAMLKGGRRGGGSMARPSWIPKKAWKVIRHGKRPKIIPKKVWKMLKAGVRTKAAEDALKLLMEALEIKKIFPFL